MTKERLHLADTHACDHYERNVSRPTERFARLRTIRVITVARLFLLVTEGESFFC
jgi:hypothetical protein